MYRKEEKQSDQDLYCFLVHLHLLETLFYRKASSFEFKGVYIKVLFVCVEANNFSVMSRRSHRFLGITSTFRE